MGGAQREALSDPAQPPRALESSTARERGRWQQQKIRRRQISSASFLFFVAEECGRRAERTYTAHTLPFLCVRSVLERGLGGKGAHGAGWDFQEQRGARERGTFFSSWPLRRTATTRRGGLNGAEARALLLPHPHPHSLCACLSICEVRRPCVCAREHQHHSPPTQPQQPQNNNQQQEQQHTLPHSSPLPRTLPPIPHHFFDEAPCARFFPTPRTVFENPPAAAPLPPIPYLWHARPAAFWVCVRAHTPPSLFFFLSTPPQRPPRTHCKKTRNLSLCQAARAQICFADLALCLSFSPTHTTHTFFRYRYQSHGPPRVHTHAHRVVERTAHARSFGEGF